MGLDPRTAATSSCSGCCGATTDLTIQNDVAPEVGGQVAPVVVLTEDEQRMYEIFLKMDPPQLQGGKREDAHEFLTTCRELLEVVGLAESHGI